MNPEDGSPENVYERIGAGSARRHVFLCTGPTCCSASEGEQSWAALKAEIKALGIPVLRSKAACLRLCSKGPWMLVYPEGTWYGEVTPERCARIVKEHLAGNRPLKEAALATHTLPQNPLCQTE